MRRRSAAIEGIRGLTESFLRPRLRPPPSMHPVTRLGRLLQQLQSFGELHASELNGLADELAAAGHAASAERVRVFAAMQRDELQLVRDELHDVRQELAQASDEAQPEAPSVHGDPALHSPKRANWLAEQQAPSKPLSRRDLLSGDIAPPGN